MIKLSTVVTADRTLVRLDGRLDRETSAALLELLAHMDRSRGAVLDLTGLASADGDGVLTLLRLESHGHALRGGSVYVERLLEEGRSNAASAPPDGNLDQPGLVETKGREQREDDSDPRLLSRVRAGDNAAFDELVRLAGPRMLAVARRMLSRESDAEDAVQEAFLSAFKSLDRFDGRSRLTTWLHRITVNVCLMKLRSQRRRGGPERSIDELLPTFLPDGHQTRDSLAWRPNATAGMEQQETRQLVRAKIDELPDQYRIVLLLRDIEELSTEETAQALGITTNAVKTRLHRARQALRGLLDPFFQTEEATL